MSFRILFFIFIGLGIVVPLFAEEAEPDDKTEENKTDQKIPPEYEKLIAEIKMLNEQEAFAELERTINAGNKDRLKVILYLFPQLLNKQDKFQRTPLFNAAYANKFELVKYLVSKKANISTPDVNGDTPLHVAASEGLKPIVEYLIQKGALIYTQNKKGETPLYKAVSMGELEVVSYLISKGAGVDVQDKKGNTTLHRAAYKGHEDMVKFLIQAGARKTAVNKNGQTPADVTKNENIRKMLQKK